MRFENAVTECGEDLAPAIGIDQTTESARFVVVIGAHQLRQRSKAAVVGRRFRFETALDIFESLAQIIGRSHLGRGRVEVHARRITSEGGVDGGYGQSARLFSEEPLGSG